MQIQVKIVKNTVDLESLFSSQFKAEQGMWVREVWRNLAHGVPFQYVDSRCLLFYKSVILSLKHLHKSQEDCKDAPCHVCYLALWWREPDKRKILEVFKNQKGKLKLLRTHHMIIYLELPPKIKSELRLKMRLH